YGRVFVDMRGIRTEHARLVRIALPDSSWPDQAGHDEASRMLRDRYGVPAGGMECVPQWLTANARPGGPPPDNASLTLDLARLDPPSRGGRSRPACLPRISPGPDAPRRPPPAQPAARPARPAAPSAARSQHAARQVAGLQAQVADLAARLGQNSGNS